MTESTFQLGSIRGIRIGIHVTWLFVFGLVTWSLAEGHGLFQTMFPEWSVTDRWGLAVLGSILLFGSVLVHELAHAVVAQKRGMRVQSITLFIFGGVANIKDEARSPMDEFLVAIVGPIASFALALFFFVLSGVGESLDPLFGLAWYLSRANLILALFNLIPGFPLDGGRVLRAILWASTNDARKSIVTAGRVGQIAAYFFIVLGIFQVIGGDLVGGLWIIFIGWFLNNAAEGSVRQYVARSNLRGFQVNTIMRHPPIVAEPGISVSSLVNDFFLFRNLRCVPIVLGNRFLGLVSPSEIKKLPREEWATRYVSEVMRRPDQIRSVSPNEDLGNAIQVMAEQDLNQLPVIVNDQLVGLLSRSDIIRFLQLRSELGTPPSR